MWCKTYAKSELCELFAQGEFPPLTRMPVMRLPTLPRSTFLQLQAQTTLFAASSFNNERMPFFRTCMRGPNVEIWESHSRHSRKAIYTDLHTYENYNGCSGDVECTMLHEEAQCCSMSR